MVNLPSIDVPTAIAAVILTLIGGYIKERFQRWRRNIASERQSQIDWYREVIRIVRETQMSILSAQAARAGYEGTVPSSEREAIELLKYSLTEQGLDVEELDDEEILDIIEEEDVEEAVKQVVEENMSDFKEKIDKEIKNELRSHHDELKAHMASCPFDFGDSFFEEVEQFLSLTYTNSLFPGLSDEDAEQIQQNGDQVKATCESEIEKLELFFTRLKKALL
jgi:L-fucose isomerase-like protein